jgi:MarR family transcriptional regulator for hemolysin
VARESLGPRVAAIYELQSVWLEPKLKKAKISWNTFQLLTAIEGGEERVSQAEVARRIGVTPATLSETVQQHVRAGMLEQRVDGSDRRVKILVLTEAGREKMKQIREMVRELENTMTKGLSDRTLQNVASALDQVAENLESI